MSLGIDVSWRKWVAREIVAFLGDGARVLDVGTGTGDLAIAIAIEARKTGKNIRIDGMDANEDMLNIAKKKIESFDIHLTTDNALDMKYPENSFDAVVSGFAIRNFDNLDEFSSELVRVMKRNGKFAIMDMALPNGGFQRFFFKVYLRIIRFFGSFLDRESYDWLAYSIEHFDFERFKDILESKGFKDVRIESLSFRITHVALGTK